MPGARTTSLTLSRLPTAPPRSLRRPAPLPPLCRKERGKRQPAPRRAGERQEPLSRPSRPPWRVLRHLRARRRALQDLPRALPPPEGPARLPPWPHNHNTNRPGGRQQRAERRGRCSSGWPRPGERRPAGESVREELPPATTEHPLGAGRSVRWDWQAGPGRGDKAPPAARDCWPRAAWPGPGPRRRQRPLPPHPPCRGLAPSNPQNH